MILRMTLIITYNSTFQQRINAIAPYIDEQKEEELKSKWALMHSRNDFDMLDKEIELVAKGNKLALPKYRFQ